MSDTIRVKKSKDEPQQYYWVRVAANNEPVATSETYTRKSDAKEAAEREAKAEDVVVVEDEVDE